MRPKAHHGPEFLRTQYGSIRHYLGSRRERLSVFWSGLLEPLRFRRYLEAKPRREALPVLQGQELRIMSVAFNNVRTIEWQWRLLQKYLTESFSYLVVDNSTIEEESRKLESLCRLENLGYVRTPKSSVVPRGPSYSHGIALNWAIRSYSKGFRYIALIDHDLFPIAISQIARLLGESSFLWPLSTSRRKVVSLARIYAL